MIHSHVLGKDVAYGIAWPAGVSSGTPLPVCFCLPGRGAGPAPILGLPLHLADFLGEVVRGQTRPFALAAVDGGQSYGHRRLSGEDRMAMLIDEFIPLCELRYKLGGVRSRRAAMGTPRSDADGFFSLDLPPGVYAFKLLATDHGFPTPATVTVQAGRVVAASVYGQGS